MKATKVDELDKELFQKKMVEIIVNDHVKPIAKNLLKYGIMFSLNLQTSLLVVRYYFKD